MSPETAMLQSLPPKTRQAIRQALAAPDPHFVYANGSAGGFALDSSCTVCTTYTYATILPPGNIHCIPIEPIPTVDTILSEEYGRSVAAHAMAKDDMILFYLPRSVAVLSTPSTPSKTVSTTKAERRNSRGFPLGYRPSPPGSPEPPEPSSRPSSPDLSELSRILRTSQISSSPERLPSTNIPRESVSDLWRNAGRVGGNRDDHGHVVVSDSQPLDPFESSNIWESPTPIQPSFINDVFPSCNAGAIEGDLETMLYGPRVSDFVDGSPQHRRSPSPTKLILPSRRRGSISSVSSFSSSSNSTGFSSSSSAYSSSQSPSPVPGYLRDDYFVPPAPEPADFSFMFDEAPTHTMTFTYNNGVVGPLLSQLLQLGNPSTMGNRSRPDSKPKSGSAIKALRTTTGTHHVNALHPSPLRNNAPSAPIPLYGDWQKSTMRYDLAPPPAPAVPNAFPAVLYPPPPYPPPGFAPPSFAPAAPPAPCPLAALPSVPTVSSAANEFTLDMGNEPIVSRAGAVRTSLAIIWPGAPAKPIPRQIPFSCAASKQMLTRNEFAKIVAEHVKGYLDNGSRGFFTKKGPPTPLDQTNQDDIWNLQRNAAKIRKVLRVVGLNYYLSAKVWVPVLAVGADDLDSLQSK